MHKYPQTPYAYIQQIKTLQIINMFFLFEKLHVIIVMGTYGYNRRIYACVIKQRMTF